MQILLANTKPLEDDGKSTCTEPLSSNEYSQPTLITHKHTTTHTIISTQMALVHDVGVLFAEELRWARARSPSKNSILSLPHTMFMLWAKTNYATVLQSWDASFIKRVLAIYQVFGEENWLVIINWELSLLLVYFCDFVINVWWLNDFGIVEL